MTKIEALTSHRAATSPRSLRTERPITARFDDHRLNFLRGLALVDGTTVAEQVRLACDAYVEKRLADPQLENKARRAMARLGRSLETLVPGVVSGFDDDELAPPPPPERDTDTETAVTLRLSQLMVDYLTSLALLDDYTIADELRGAADVYIAARLSDDGLQEQIQRNREDRDDLLNLLARAG